MTNMIRSSGGGFEIETTRSNPQSMHHDAQIADIFAKHQVVKATDPVKGLAFNLLVDLCDCLQLHQ